MPFIVPETRVTRLARGLAMIPTVDYRPSRTARVAMATFALTMLSSRVATAQTDFYNTDRGRPLQVEDAYVTERYAFELKLAPVRVERTQGGTYNWGVEPEIALGVLPRTQIELGLPLAFREQGSERRSGVAGLEISAMHNFNVETKGVPALALRADVLAPVGNLAAERAYASLTAMATRTYSRARFHINGQYTFGAEPAPRATGATTGTREPDALEISRWLAGLSIDKAFPLRSTLIAAELYGQKPLDSDADVEYTAGVGTRFQMSPSLALDAGVGRRLNGDERGWYITFGSAYEFGARSFFPGGR